MYKLAIWRNIQWHTEGLFGILCHHGYEREAYCILGCDNISAAPAASIFKVEECFTLKMQAASPCMNSAPVHQ